MQQISKQLCILGRFEHRKMNFQRILSSLESALF